MQLERDDLITGLQEVIREARERGIRNVSIQIVGGAALRLAYFDRTTTVDIDAHIEPVDELVPVIDDVARRHGWPKTWLNDEAAIFIPRWGERVDWRPLFDDDGVSISVASVDALLAMKLNAARPGRDTDDIAKLLVVNDIQSVDDAEELFERFYPGEVLPEKTIKLVARIYELGLPQIPQVPRPPDLDPRR